MKFQIVQRKAPDSAISKIQKKVTQKLSRIIKTYCQAEQDLLIHKLNEVTKGWAEYHHCVCAKSTSAQIDHRMWEMLCKWAQRRHLKKSHKWIKRRYWRSKANRQWIFRTDKQVLFLMSDIPIVRNSSLDRTKIPYIEPEYFSRYRNKHKELRKSAYARSAAACGQYYAL